MAAESDIADLEYFDTSDLTSAVKQPGAFSFGLKLFEIKSVEVEEGYFIMSSRCNSGFAW